MADDFDVEALLEAPYMKEVNGVGESRSEEPIRNGKKDVDETKSSCSDSSFDSSRSSSITSSSDKEKNREKSVDERDVTPPAAIPACIGEDDAKSKRRDRSRSPSHHRSRSKRGSKSRHRSRSGHRTKSVHRSQSRHSESSKLKRRSRSPHRSKSRQRNKSKSPPSRSRSKRRSGSNHRSRSKHRSGSKHRSSPKRRSTSKRRSISKRRSVSKRRSISKVRSISKRRSTSKSRSISKRRSSSKGRSSSKRRSSRSPPGVRSRSKRRSRSRHRTRSRDGAAPPPLPPKRRSRTPSKDRKRRRKSLTPISLPGRREGGVGGGGGSSRPPYPRYRKASPIGPPPPIVDDLTPEERDARTIFCMQLSQRIRAKDLEEFFSSVGKVRDVRLITCNKTRRFKGIAYIEFKDPESVALALGLNGQKLLGIPIIVQPTQAEKNRMGNTLPNLTPRNHPGPVRLYVGSLHYNITEDMLRGIFEPFGKIDSIMLMTDPETGRSKGYGFVTYHNSEDAKKALEQMNGFELAGRPMKVNNVTERQEFSSGPSMDETDERAGIDLGATGRLQLMYKLAEGTGMQIPAAAASALNLNPVAPVVPTTTVAPPIATQCFLLANMFDPYSESAPNWEIEIRDDVIEECNRHGGCVHVFVDKASPQGNVYVKCSTITTAVAAVNSLHGRYFGGRIITAAYVPIINYHTLFPETITSSAILAPSRKSTA